MRTLSPPLPIESVGDTEVSPPAGDRGPTPATGSSGGVSFNLARPWKFPAGHPDSVFCRRHSRSSVQVPVEISLYRPDGSSYDQGTGVVQDLSYSGLRLGDVFLARGRLLVTYFGVALRPALESHGGCDITGRILRTFSSGRPGFGIEFLAPDSGAQARFRKIAPLASRRP